MIRVVQRSVTEIKLEKWLSLFVSRVEILLGTKLRYFMKHLFGTPSSIASELPHQLLHVYLSFVSSSVEGAHDFLGNSANTDSICQAKG